MKLGAIRWMRHTVLMGSGPTRIGGGQSFRPAHLVDTAFAF
jgi:hypothetical protein